MFIRRYIWMLLSLCLLTGCSFRSFHETLSVVGEADSLWQQGQMCDDSVRLAQAYSTLRVWRTFYADAYAHTCYHYGKLLRANDDPVAAMQVFIDATHSRTRDYHILGRVYSNMGDICHCAGDYALSYNMFEHSANIFLRDDDTLSYYYCLNNMAFELAEQGKKEETLALLNTIDSSDSVSLSLINLTKAEMYKIEELYDSAIYYANLTCSIPQHQLTRILIKAQSYSYMQIHDSAVYYANELVLHTDELFYINTALYILTHEDKKKDIEEVRNISADRSDIQKLIEIRQGKLSQAVQLLEQELARKPNLTWLYAVCFTLIIMGLCIWGYVHKKRRQYQLLSQQVTELEDMNFSAKLQHNQLVQEHAEYKKGLVAQIEKTCSVFNQSPHLQKDLCWSNYNQMCEIVNQQFFFFAQKLQNTYILTEREIRLCVLVLIGITNSKQLAEMLLYSESGIRNFKNRTAKKLSTNSIELRHKLLKIAAGE